MSSSSISREKQLPLEERAKLLEIRIESAKKPAERNAIADEYIPKHEEVLALSAVSEKVDAFFRNEKYKLYVAWVSTFLPLTPPDFKLDVPLSEAQETELKSTVAMIQSLKSVNFLQQTPPVESKTSEEDVVKKVSAHYPLLKHLFIKSSPVYAEFCLKHPKMVEWATAVMAKSKTNIAFPVTSSSGETYLPTHQMIGKYFVIQAYRLQFLKKSKEFNAECQDWLDVACQYGNITAMIARIRHLAARDNPFETNVLLHLKQLGDLYGQFGYFIASTIALDLSSKAVAMQDAKLQLDMRELSAIYALASLKLEQEPISQQIMQIETRGGTKSIFSEKSIKIDSPTEAIKMVQKKILYDDLTAFARVDKLSNDLVAQRKQALHWGEEKTASSGMVRSSRERGGSH